MRNDSTAVKFTNHNLQGCEASLCCSKQVYSLWILWNSATPQILNPSSGIQQRAQRVIKSREIHRFTVTQKLHPSSCESCKRSSSLLTVIQHPRHCWLTRSLGCWDHTAKKKRKENAHPNQSVSLVLEAEMLISSNRMTRSFHWGWLFLRKV